MGNRLEQLSAASLEQRIIDRAQDEVQATPASVFLPAAMRLAGCETDMQPNPETVAAWAAKLK